MEDSKQYLDELLLTAAQQGATDLHLSPGHYPILRVDGRLIMLSNKSILDKETLEGLVFTLLGDEKKAHFLSEKELDFSYCSPSLRANPHATSIIITGKRNLFSTKKKKCTGCRG